jgi:hypothetical protein
MQAEEPDLKLAGLSLWVFGRQFPDANDYWDGNWINIRARVEASGAFVEALGALVHISELESFVKELEVLDATLAGEASLQCMEPNLGVTIRSESLGHMTATISITPDHMRQSHSFIFELDQSYLKSVLTGCKSILSRFPPRGTKDRTR